MRHVTLLLCLALAGCLTSQEPAGTGSSGSGTTAAEPAPAEAPRRPTQASRGTGPPAALPPERDPKYTAEQRLVMIRQICWSQVDKDRALKTIDARSAWVDKCVADKRKEPVGQPAGR